MKTWKKFAILISSVAILSIPLSKSARIWIRDHFVSISLEWIVAIGVVSIVASTVVGRMWWQALREDRRQRVRDFSFISSVLIALIYLFGLIPAFLFFHNAFVGVRNYATDARPWYFIVVFLALFGVTFWSVWKSKSQSENFVHAVVLVIALCSFYAFGFPKELANPQGMGQEIVAEAMRDRFAELCVIFVLFLLSELAIRLNYDAIQIREDLHSTADNILVDLGKRTSETKDAIAAAEQPISNAESSLREILKEVGEAKLPKHLGELQRFLGRLEENFEIVKSADGFPMKQRPAATRAAARWIQQWSALFTRTREEVGKKSEMQGQLLADLFQEYVTAEVKAFGSPLECPTRLVNKHISGEMVFRDREDGSIMTPRIISSDEMYSKFLLAIVERAQEVLLPKGGAVSNGRLLYVAISNLLPADWFNWKQRDGSACEFKGVDNYIVMLRKMLGLGAVDYKRVIVVDAGAQYCRLRSEFSDPGPGGAQRAESKLPAFLGTEMDLEFDFSKLYGLIFANGNKPKAKEIGAFRSYEISELRDKLEVVLGEQKKNGGLPRDEGRLPARLFRFTQRSMRVYPILSVRELAEIGITPSAEAEDGSAVYKDIGDMLVGVIPLRKIFLERLELGDAGSKCEVYCLEDPEDLELFPDRKTDILEIGYETEAGEKNWILALATALVPGENVMSMRLITDQALLAHIANLGAYFASQNKVNTVETGP